MPPRPSPTAIRTRSGSIGLCNQAGQQITSGNINTVPFAWRAVSTQPAQAPYNNAYRTAILMAYQPIQELTPGRVEWRADDRLLPVLEPQQPDGRGDRR